MPFVRSCRTAESDGSVPDSCPRESNWSEINDQDSVGGIDSRADIRRQQAALEQGRHAVGWDRQLHGGDVLVPQQAALALDLGQHVGIEHDTSRILLARRVGGDGRRDHFSLGPQTVALRFDQPRMILAQVEDAAEEDDEADHVGENDPPQQRLGDKADEWAVGQELIEPDAAREISDIAGNPLARRPQGPGHARQIRNHAGHRSRSGVGRP